MISINCKIVRGWGRAGACIAIQKKFFAKTIPSISRYFNGTINVISEESPFPLFKSFVTFYNLHWKMDRWETFILYPVLIELGNQSKRGWLYKPYGSHHFREKNYVEIIAPKFRIGKFRKLKILIDENN